MAYAQDRVIYDADSHIMELPDFLKAYADPAQREWMPLVPAPRAGKLANLMDDAMERRAHPPERVAEMVAMGDSLISGPKGYMALGAFNRDERKTALDMLGFKRQLVFGTFSVGAAFAANNPVEERYAVAAAHNRGMAEFCSQDKRLMGVAILPLDVTVLALAEIDNIIRLGLKAVWVPHRACGGRSPGHNDLDPVWAKLAEAGIPFVLHVGGYVARIGQDFMNTGRPIPTDWMGGGENIRGKDMLGLHHMAENFLGAMVLDGVFERHPTLRGGAIELGAGWVPSMIERLDWVADIWKKSEPDLAALKRKPSQQIIEQLAFTPFPYEKVGDLIRQSHPDLYLFSSDYPHIEGGRQPLGRFEASLEGHTAETKDGFYAKNFARLFADA